MAAKTNPSDGNSQKPTIMIVNPEFQENILQCQICVSKYNKSERRPKTLCCGHVFCLSCLKQIFVQVPGNVRNALKCPSCRRETLIMKDINDLTPAFLTEQLMEEIATTETLNLCSKHQGQTLNFYCLTCSVPVCRDCTVVAHNRSDNHNITELSKVLADQIDQFKKIKTESEGIRRRLNGRSKDLKNSIKRLDEIKEREMRKVDMKFDEYNNFVQMRQIELKTQISETIESLKRDIQIQNDHVDEQLIQFQGVYDSFCAARNSKDVNKILTMNEEMEAHKTQLSTEVERDITELFKSCSVSFDNESLLSCLTDFGKITVKADPEIMRPDLSTAFHKLREAMLQIAESFSRVVGSGVSSVKK